MADGLDVVEVVHKRLCAMRGHVWNNPSGIKPTGRRMRHCLECFEGEEWKRLEEWPFGKWVTR